MTLHAISPIDGRYAAKTKALSKYFSEFALIRYRLLVEVEYIKALAGCGLAQLSLNQKETDALDEILASFNDEDGQRVKDIEKITNHDVKAVEYFIKEKISGRVNQGALEFIHFGLTSQDINNTAFPLMIKDALTDSLLPAYRSVCRRIHELANEYKGIPMLARTHGQPASPTTLGKEMLVFAVRLEKQIDWLEKCEHSGKFGGATGNFNAHKVSFPNMDWPEFGNEFLHSLGLKRQEVTTQIEHYDELATLFHTMERIHTILIDFTRDIWSYISMDYFKQKVIANEVGSSAMPHKVNPIDFENAEGNLGMANAVLHHLASKLPVSRLQRDLTDSTVLRNVGLPFGYALIAAQSLEKGMGKLMVNVKKMEDDLENNWAVVAEAIQNILRREGYEKPYEALKDLTRNHSVVNRENLHAFIDGLKVSDEVKSELKSISPHNYVGYF